jgi:hypothetical protein
MNANQLERAAYVAAHAILSASLSAPELACPGARRSRQIDRVAEIIKTVFGPQCTEFGGASDGRASVRTAVMQPKQRAKILPFHAETAAPLSIG